MSTIPVADMRGLDAYCLPCGGWDEWFVTCAATSGERAGCCMDRVEELVAREQLSPCLLFAFGQVPGGGAAARLEAWAEGRFPVMWIGGPGCGADGFAGLQLIAMSGTDVVPVRVGDTVCGVTAETSSGRFCLLGDVHASNPDAGREDQAHTTFELLDAGMQAAGLSMSAVVRTWLYVDRILDWYDAFNSVRTPFFRDCGMFEGLVPASTGIGAPNRHGSAVTAAAFGWVPAGDAAAVVEVASPLQCSAQAYGSSFSRAVEVQTRASRRLIVSGTASIDPQGTTVHVDDVAAQTNLTMEVIGAILESRGMTFADTIRAIVYVTSAQGAACFADWCRHAGVTLPCVVTKTDICRDDLLFEVELDAAVCL